ncbi:MAG: GPP34 family phosphoprotein [Alphaproteobacteria bacterium]|nr:GPP34 family phosphoprotein [Alphaproteobacteria bacterium]
MTAAARAGPFTISEEVLLILLNDERGALAQLPRINVDCALAGAVLMELAFANRIGTGLETLFIVDRRPTGHPLLDPVLAKIAARGATADTRAWLRVLVAEDVGRIRDQALMRLVRRGLLERRDGSFRWALDPVPAGRPGRRRGVAGIAGTQGRRRAGRRIGQRIREALLLHRIPDPRDAALIGLVETCDLLGALVPEEYLDRLRPHVARLRRLGPIGRQAARVVLDIERSVAETLAVASPAAMPGGAAARRHRQGRADE